MKYTRCSGLVYDLIQVAVADRYRTKVRGTTYLGERPGGLADVSDYGVTLSSVSKAWGGPGLRLGWAVGDPRVLEPARLVHNYMTTAAARPSQRAALALLKASDVVLPAARLALKERWEAFSGALEKGRYYIQIGAFASEAAAKDAASRLSVGYLLLIQQATSRGKATWKVFIGPLSRDESGVALVRVRSMGYRDAFVKSGG